MKARILSTDCYDGTEIEVDGTCFCLSLPSPHPTEEAAYVYHLLGTAKDGRVVFIEERLFEAISA